MNKKRKDTDYLCLSAQIRSMERSLLDRARMERMLEAPNLAEAVRLLTEVGYEAFDPASDSQLNRALLQRRLELFERLYRYAPEPQIIDVFKLKYDYHNLKAVLKARGADVAHLLVDAGRVPAGEWQRPGREGQWDFLPPAMAAAAKEGQRVLAETGDPQRSDALVDRAYFAEYQAFVEEKTAAFVTPGHQEIELALMRLYHYLGNNKHLELARFFLNHRGANEKDCTLYHYGKEYSQDNVPVREITEAVGHSVRAAYMYTGMQMLAKVDGDEALQKACDRVFDNIVHYKMAITGGMGSDQLGEKFSYNYDIPNSDTYNETCAAISLAMFAGALQEVHADSRYGDIIERVLYNGFISGVSLDGAKFFYSNPLEVDRKKFVRSTYQAPGERVKVFECSCCPPNVVRTLASVANYMYSVDESTVYCNQFAASETTLQIGGKDALLKQITNYPFDGKITFQYSGEPVTLRVRIPEWCVEYTGETKNGFAEFSLNSGDSVTVDLPMAIHFVEANPYVQDNSGRFAVQRGPIVYCMEELDNGENLRDIRLLEDGTVRMVTEEGIPAPVIYMDAQRRTSTQKLYSLKSSSFVNFTAKLIPYFSFANREATDMIVWTMVK